MENWRGGDRDETQNGAHVMRRKGCAMQNKGITLIENIYETLKNGYTKVNAARVNRRTAISLLLQKQKDLVFVSIIKEICGTHV